MPLIISCKKDNPDFPQGSSGAVNVWISEQMEQQHLPYIEVVHIGEPTYGKDMASTTLTTPASVVETEPSWHILPIYAGPHTFAPIDIEIL